MDKYDSTQDTKDHITNVQNYMMVVQWNLAIRAEAHDASKLEQPEKGYFDEFTPKLKDVEYGTPEYAAMLQAMLPGIEHHYAHNDHHPQHFADGFKGMSLMALMEMLSDWKAASERHEGGSLAKSLEINKGRFGLSDDVHQILVNTARELGWI